MKRTNGEKNNLQLWEKTVFLVKVLQFNYEIAQFNVNIFTCILASVKPIFIASSSLK